MIFFFPMTKSKKLHVLESFLRLILTYEENNVHLPGNSIKNIFILAVILAFRFSRKAEPK